RPANSAPPDPAVPVSPTGPGCGHSDRIFCNRRRRRGTYLTVSRWPATGASRTHQTEGEQIMWHTALLVRAGLCLLLGLPAVGSDTPGARLRGGRLPRAIELRGELGYQGNLYTKMPDGSTSSTLRTYEWEGYFVVADGVKYVLDLPIGHDQAEGLRG